MTTPLKISTIVPLFNEELGVETTIYKLQKSLEKTGCEYEIIIINDGSTDATGRIIESLNLPHLKLFKHAQNIGYGATIKTGIRHASYDWILIIDGDGTYPSESILDFTDYAEEFDMIIGSREKKDNAIPLKRRHAKKFLNKFASYLAGSPIPDLNSGLRLFKKSIALKFWELFPDKFSFTSTLTMVCLTHGYNVKFLPINYHKRIGNSSLKAHNFLSFLKLVTKLSLFFRPFKVFAPLSLIILLIAITIPIAFFMGATERFPDATFIVLCASAMQTFFFGLIAEIIIHNK